MIRINLLAVDRGVGKKKAAAAAPGVTTAQRVTIAAALILVSTVTGVGWWYWSLHTESRQLDDDIARAEVEAQQLRSVLAQVQKYETEKARLQQRVTLIEQLRRGQTGPVHILDEVSKSLPDRLWLVSMGQRDKEFTIDGRTTSLSVLSDFVASLESSSWFTKPVEIVDTAVDQTPAGDMVRFTVRAMTQNPEGAVVSIAPAGRGAPPAR
jgi:type IV pilus assembly protein PilN